jgi:hypothetical protein
MKKLVVFVMFIVALAMMTAPTAQAVVFYSDDCVENGTPWQNAQCLWDLHIAIMHEEGFQDLYGGLVPTDTASDTLVAEATATYGYTMIIARSPVTWVPLRT